MDQKMHKIIILLISLLIVGCDFNIDSDKNVGSNKKSLKIEDRYQVISGTNGILYRLDKATGEMWYVRDTTMQKVMEEGFKIKVGERYTGDDGFEFTYNGKGTLKDIKSVE